MKRFSRILIAALLLATPTSLQAQYWGERVQEKGFEESDFFFSPTVLNPFGMGSFRSVTVGLLNDPFLNLAVNPARLTLDSGKTFMTYTDFRSARTVTDKNPGYIGFRSAADVNAFAPRSYNWIYQNTRRVLEPVFSGAVMARLSPEVMLGATYQLMLQDDKYYNVPQDIYQSVLGQDYAGNKAAAASTLPIVDRYNGQDNMHQQGHFAALFASLELPDLGRIGVKAGRAMFNRSGGYGSTNNWGSLTVSNGSSLWSNLESRNQGYGHWELAGGADLRLGERIRLGLTGGRLWGDATQALHDGDTSFYQYSSTQSGTSNSFYLRSGNTQEEWRQHGRTLQLGGDIRYQVTPEATLQLLYHHERTTVDLLLGSSIVDTSYSTYAYTYGGTSYASTSYWLLQDQRAGSGQRISTTNRLLASVDWRLSDRVRLVLGAQLDWMKSETNTTETVLMHGGSSYTSTGTNPYNYSYGNGESKDLLWTFTANRTNFQIPIMLTLKASDVIEILLGLNRVMSSSKVDDMTLALFRYRESSTNGVVKRDENFGERYTTPTEQSSDVTTTFLAGLTAAASEHFSLRLVMVPNFKNAYDGTELEALQWWIGVTVKP